MAPVDNNGDQFGDDAVILNIGLIQLHRGHVLLKESEGNYEGII